MKINSYTALIAEADMNTVYAKVKPFVMNEADVDPAQHKKHSVVRVFDNDIQDFANKTICTDNSVFFLVQPTERIEFSEKGNLHIFEPYEMILVSAGDSARFKKWQFERVDDVVNFSNHFEAIEYGQYENERNSIDSLKETKADQFKTKVESEYSAEKQKLTEKSSISIKFPSFKKNN